MLKFCIKKNAGSTNSPWLSRFKGEYVYSSLDCIEKGITTLVEFDRAADAIGFIKANLGLCDSRCIICEVKKNAEGKMVMIPQEYTWD